MEQTRYLWHLGLAMLSLLAGIFHIVYCCLFYTSGQGVANAVLLAFIGLTGLIKGRPSARFIVYTHIALLIAGINLLTLNAVSWHCTQDPTTHCQIEQWSYSITVIMHKNQLANVDAF